MDALSIGITNVLVTPITSPFGKYQRAEQITGAPAKVSAVHPLNTAVNQQLDIVLSWSRPVMAQSYDVWFGATAGTMVKVGSAQAARSYVPTLALNSSYAWRVDAKNTLGTTTGDVNTFSTWASTNILLDENDNPITDENGEYIETE